MAVVSGEQPSAKPVALVTGAGRGIGAATAKTLSADGWDVVLIDSCADNPALDYAMCSREELDATAGACGGVAVVADVRHADQLVVAAEVAQEQFGRLDAAIAAAGVIVGGEPLWEMSDDRWDALFDVNVKGVLNLARAAIPGLTTFADQAPGGPGGGRFIAISSGIALKASPKLAAYSASKAAVIGLVRGLAADLANTGITANVIQPGTTNTSVLAPSAQVYDLPDPVEFTEHHIDNRILDPSEVASAIAWLAGPGSSAINGAVIPVDAGMTAR